MESSINLLLYSNMYENASYWAVIFRFSLVTTLVIIFTRLLWRWKKYVAMIDKLPMLKPKYYHLLGHAYVNYKIRSLKRPLPYHVYDFVAMNGYSYLFKKHGLVAFWAFLFPVVQVQKSETVEIILNNSTELEKAFTYRFTKPWLGDGLLTSSGSKWKNRRKLLTPAFHFNILKDFVSIFNKQSKILVSVLCNHTTEESIDIVSFLTKCSFDIMSGTVLGVEMDSQTNQSCQYLNSVNILTSALFERMMTPYLWPDFIFKHTSLGRKFYEHRKLVHDFTYKLINQKKKKKLLFGTTEEAAGDEHVSRKKRALLDLLLDEHINNNSLSENDIREEVDTFTFEGHDTTAVGMSWALYLIGLHPVVQEKIRQEVDNIFEDSDRDITMDDLKEMKYLECVLKESLRLYPSVPYFGRQLKQDLEFQGLTVPKGTTCMVFPFFLHRDPDVFPNPEKFDPERFTPENSAGRHPFAYVPFSAGPRNCIGQKFALLEEKVVISSILRKFKLRSLDPRDKIHIMNEIVLRPLGGLRIEIRLRNYNPEKSPSFFYNP